MLDWPTPSNLRQLWDFLGLTGYYRRFIRDYGKIAKLLTNLLKKDAFLWNDLAETAFNTLKQVMTKPPVLALPNYNDLFTIETDASG